MGLQSWIAKGTLDGGEVDPSSGRALLDAVKEQTTLRSRMAYMGGGAFSYIGRIAVGVLLAVGLYEGFARSGRMIDALFKPGTIETKKEIKQPEKPGLIARTVEKVEAEKAAKSGKVRKKTTPQPTTVEVVDVEATFKNLEKENTGNLPLEGPLPPTEHILLGLAGLGGLLAFGRSRGEKGVFNQISSGPATVTSIVGMGVFGAAGAAAEGAAVAWAAKPKWMQKVTIGAAAVGGIAYFAAAPVMGAVAVGVLGTSLAGRSWLRQVLAQHGPAPEEAPRPERARALPGRGAARQLPPEANYAEYVDAEARVVDTEPTHTAEPPARRSRPSVPPRRPTTHRHR